MRFEAEVEDYQILRDTDHRLDPYRVAPRLALETRLPERSGRLHFDLRGEVARFDHRANLVANGTRLPPPPVRGPPAPVLVRLPDPEGDAAPRRLRPRGVPGERPGHPVPYGAVVQRRRRPPLSSTGPGSGSGSGGSPRPSNLGCSTCGCRTSDQDHLPLFDAGSFTFGYDHMFRREPLQRRRPNRRCRPAYPGPGQPPAGRRPRGVRRAHRQRCSTSGSDASGCAPARIRLRARRAARSPMVSWRRRPVALAFHLDRRAQGPPPPRLHDRERGGARRRGLPGTGRSRSTFATTRPRSGSSTSAIGGSLAKTTSAGLVQESVDDMTETVTFSAHRDLGPNLRLLGSASYALEADRATELYAGIEYDSCCLAHAGGRATLPLGPSAPSMRGRSWCNSSSRA